MFLFQVRCVFAVFPGENPYFWSLANCRYIVVGCISENEAFLGDLKCFFATHPTVGVQS